MPKPLPKTFRVVSTSDTHVGGGANFFPARHSDHQSPVEPSSGRSEPRLPPDNPVNRRLSPRGSRMLDAVEDTRHGAHRLTRGDDEEIGARVAPDGRRLLRLEVRNAQKPIEKKPAWIKTRARSGPEFTELKALVKRQALHTVCEEARCPNIYECWEDREATFLIGGNQCTRRCDFCQIETGKPAALDRDEPGRVARSVQAMGLKYATITGVARDDQPDGGAWLYAETVRQVHALNPDTGLEVLIPDFNAKPDLLAEVFSTRPEVLAHNIETVPRIFKRIRPGFRYDRSIDVIRQAHADGLVTKSNLILGMGEEREEISQAMQDLYDVGCELLTVTQYLRPSVRHHPVTRWVKPEEFVALKEEAEQIGFVGVMSAPLVRSSYRAGRLYDQAMRRRAAVGRTVI